MKPFLINLFQHKQIKLSLPNLTFHQVIFMFYLIWSFVRSAFTTSTHNTLWVTTQIRPLTYLIEPILLSLIVFFSIVHFRFEKRLGVFYLFSLGLFAIFILSLVANLYHIDVVNSIKFFFGYFKFIFLVIYISVFFNDSSHIKLVSVTIVGLVVLQLVVNFLWAIGFQILNNVRATIPNNADWAYGTTENTVIIALLSAILISYGMYRFFYLNEKKILYFVYIVGGVVMVSLAEVKTNFVTISLSIFFVTFVLNKKITLIKNIIVPGLIFCAFMLVAINFYSQKSAFQKGGDLLGTTSYLYSKVSQAMDYNIKFIFVDKILNEIPDKLYISYFGAGPGNLGSHFALENPTELSSIYLVPLYDMNFDFFRNSTLTAPDFGFGAILADLGIIGFVVYFALHLYFIIAIALKFRQGYYKEKWTKISSIVWLTFSINYFLVQVFFDSLYFGAPLIVLWSLGTMLILINEKEKLSQFFLINKSMAAS